MDSGEGPFEQPVQLYRRLRVERVRLEFGLVDDLFVLFRDFGFRLLGDLLDAKLDVGLDEVMLLGHLGVVHLLQVVYVAADVLQLLVGLVYFFLCL